MYSVPAILLASLLLVTACSKGGKFVPLSLEDIDIPLRGASIISDIQGDPYRYFRYDSAESAQKDLARISRDGSTIAGDRMPWDGPVRIYYRKERIVIYVGENPETIAAIEQVFGKQVAGDE